MQQKLVSQIEALEIRMKLEASSVGDNGSEMIQLQSHLANLMVQFQDIKRGKEFHEELFPHVSICGDQCVQDSTTRHPVDMT